jgi:hypothetical protein
LISVSSKGIGILPLGVSSKGIGIPPLGVSSKGIGIPPLDGRLHCAQNDAC